MIIDSQLEFSDKQAVTATVISTNTIDTLPNGNNTLTNLGVQEEMYLVIKTTSTVTSAGASTVTFTLESDSAADLTVAPVVHWTSGAIPKASLVAGFEVVAVALPKGIYKRYLALRYAVGTGPLTAGNFAASLVRGVDAQRNYNDNVSYT